MVSRSTDSGCSRACSSRLPPAFFTFFASTFIAIIALLVWNGIGGHTVNYADSYLYVGFPAGVIVLAVALPVFGTLWVRAKLRK